MSPPFTKKINSIVADNEKVILINEARPIDFYECLERNVQEITIIAHIFQIMVKRSL